MASGAADTGDISVLSLGGVQGTAFPLKSPGVTGMDVSAQGLAPE